MIRKTKKCADCQKPASEEQLMARLDEVLKDYISLPGGLIPALQVAQGIFGYLPEAVMKHIASAFDKSYSEVAGVVGFYSFFSTQPRGKHLVRVCMGTACYVRGGKQVLDALRKELAVEVGSTTADKVFSLEVGRCFGACGLAPTVMIDDDVHQRVKPNRVGEMLEPYRQKADASRAPQAAKRPATKSRKSTGKKKA